MRIIDQPCRLEIVSRTPRLRRFGLAALALLPLLAPYELLVKPGWDGISNPIFFAAALLSLGATAVSAFLIWAAVAGLDQSLVFDVPAGRFEYTSNAPAAPRRRIVVPFSRVAGVEVRVHAWSEGEERYALRVTSVDGRSFESGWCPVRADVEAAEARIRTFLRETASQEPAGAIAASNGIEPRT